MREADTAGTAPPPAGAAAVAQAGPTTGPTTGVEPSPPPPSQPERQRRAYRRRRNSTVDTAQEAGALILAVLKSRGAAGARPEELGQVLAWARATRAASRELQQGQKGRTGGRRRRQSTEASERQARAELSLLLLEQVLSGHRGLDVRDGKLVFLGFQGAEGAA